MPILMAARPRFFSHSYIRKYMSWTLRETHIHSEFLSRDLFLEAPVGEAPVKELVYDGLLQNADLVRILNTFLSSRQHIRVKPEASFEVAKHEDDSVETWHFNGPVSEVNPPTMHPRDVQATTAAQLLLEIVEQIFDRLHYLQSLQGG